MNSIYEQRICKEAVNVPADAVSTTYVSYIWNDGGQTYLGEMFGTGEWLVWEFLTPNYFRKITTLAASSPTATRSEETTVSVWQSEETLWVQWGPQLARCIAPIRI